MTHIHIAATRLSHDLIASFDADHENDLVVWEVDEAASEAAGTTVLSFAELHVQSSYPTFAFDKETGRLDKSTVVGRRLTAILVHADGKEEEIYLYTSKAARKAARAGHGDRKVKLYVEVDPAVADQAGAEYRYFRATGTTGADFVVTGLVHGISATELEEEINAVLNAHFGDRLGDYLGIATVGAADRQVHIVDASDNSVIASPVYESQVELVTADLDVDVVPVDAKVYVR